MLSSETVASLAGSVLCAAVGHPSALGVEVGQSVPHDVFDRHVSEVAAEVAAYGVAGVCWFPSRPEGDRPDLVAGWTARLRAAAGPDLLVATDQEGGRVARMREGFFVAPAARSYAGDLAAIRADAARTGRELLAVGINADFAPVADIDSNPANPVIGARAYATSPEQVAACVLAAMAGFAEAGAASCVKHFPGHGDTAVDSHLGLPVIERDPEAWAALEAVPFRAAVAAGVPLVMTGHLVLTGYGDQPATFSHRLLTGVLRDEWGYRGVVVSDSLLMAGARQGRSDDDLVVDALAAGVDLLLLPPSIPGAVAALVRAVEDGRLPRERLVEAAGRVRALREQYRLRVG